MGSIDQFNKILLIRPEMMGDTILLTPIISAIKKFHPESKIYMFLQPGMEEIVKNNEDVAGWIFTKKNLNFSDFFGLLNKIKKEKFDVSIVFEDNPTPIYALLCLMAGIPKRLGDKARLAYGWIYNKGIWIASADPTKHHIELYLKLLEPLGVKDCKLPLKINPDSEAEINIHNILPQKNEGEVFVGLHIGTGGGNRAFLPETYAQISDLIQDKLKCKIFLIGGERELETLQEIKSTAKHPFMNLVNILSMQELFSAIKRMDVFIGVDSGPLHAAAALNIPTVAIYTAKDVNPARWFPWMARNMIIKSPGDSCKIRCSHRECDYDYCLKAIEPLSVVGAVFRLLEGKGNTTLKSTRKAALA